MPHMKTITALLLCLGLLLTATSVSAQPDNAIQPFRLNVSRIEMGDASNANTGCYFVFNGQENLLVNNTYSRAVLASWNSTRGCYEVIGSLGYAGMKTEWDIPADGFALMISSFSESNAFDSQNFAPLNEYFSYDSNELDDCLVGQPVYLYNINLKNGSVVTSGIEGDDDFASMSYVTVGKPDDNAETAPYNGEGVLIDKSQEIPYTVDVYSKMYLSSFSVYRGEGTPDGNIYGQCFFIMPDDENIDEALELITWAFACVIEENGGEYRVIHTAQWSSKSDWKEIWLTDEDGRLYNNRFILACHILNDETNYPEIYKFEMQNWRTAYYKLDPDTSWGGPGEEGAACGMQVFFYNVDFKNRAVMTDGMWGTQDFTSRSYVTFGAKDYPQAVTTASVSQQTTGRVTVNDSNMSPFSDKSVMLAVGILIGAAVALVILLFIRGAQNKKNV